MGIFSFIKNLFSTGQTIADIPMDIQIILQYKFSGAKYSVGEDYESLIWYDDNTVSKPSKQDFQDMWDDVLLIIAQNEVIEQINTKRDLDLSKDVLGEAEGKQYYFQRNLTAEIAWLNNRILSGDIISNEDIVTESWITSTNEIVSLTKLELINICSHLRDRDNLLRIQARKHKDRVLALTTLEQVSSYDINEVII
jgi:hypothetical protein